MPANKKQVNGPKRFSHLNSTGEINMVNIASKPVQTRRATASGRLVCKPATICALRQHALPKGDVLAVAKVAAIQAVKRTADVIPLCHPLPITWVDVDFKILANRIDITCTVETDAKTGVEMEALHGAGIAALTLYDMCKAVDKTMRIENICVIEKIKL